MARGAVTTEDWDRYPAPPNSFGTLFRARVRMGSNERYQPLSNSFALETGEGGDVRKTIEEGCIQRRPFVNITSVRTAYLRPEVTAAPSCRIRCENTSTSPTLGVKTTGCSVRRSFSSGRKLVVPPW